MSSNGVGRSVTLVALVFGAHLYETNDNLRHCDSRFDYVIDRNHFLNSPRQQQNADMKREVLKEREDSLINKRKHT